MSLSAIAKPFISTKPKGTIVSWNVLSDILLDSISDAVASSQNTLLFTTSFFKKRIGYILQTLETLIAAHKYPIFCLQEVNDSHDLQKSLSHSIRRFLQDRHYIVLESNFGTFDKVYPELGLITAIPSSKYDILTSSIQQISVVAPNTFIAVTLRQKAFPDSFVLVNTHFPAKFHDKKYMRQFTESFQHHLSFTNSKLIVCGDFNTTNSDPWYLLLRNSMNDLPEQDKHITHISIQRRDRRSSHNTIFQGFLDHFFWTRDITITLTSKLLSKLSSDRLDMLKNPSKDNPHILPTIKNPSDHIPVVVRYQLL
jgi:endonuclease/exonuclease/phosphatase family metal-dependent hydrolase